MTRPRAVFITPIEPALTGNGLAMRMGVSLMALTRFADVDVIVAPLAGGLPQIGPRSLVAAVGARSHVVPTHDAVDTQYSLLMRLFDHPARLSAFRAYGKPSLASPLSPRVLGQIGRIIGNCRPEIVHVGRSYLSEVVSLAPSSAIATLDLDEDDFENFASQARLARSRGRTSESDWLLQEGRACDVLVERFGRKFHRLFVASDREARSLSRRHPCLRFTTIENAIEVPRLSPRRDDGKTLVFVGSLGYSPNCDGLLWLAGEVLPRLAARRGGNWRLVIAGSHAPEVIANLGRRPGVRVLGRVDDLSHFYRKATLSLAPMRSGGGTRIKLLEAAAHGVASVMTREAGDGLEWPPNAGGWRAATAGEFAAACEKGLSDPTERRRRVELARRWISNRHTRERVIFRLAAALKSGLSLH